MRRFASRISVEESQDDEASDDGGGVWHGGDGARHGRRLRRRRSRRRRARSKARRRPMAAFACSRASRLRHRPWARRRWKAPAPAAPWTAVKKAVAFGPRCPQGRIFGDMVFRDEMSEDCLYVNVWTPAAKAGAEAAGDVLDSRRRLPGRLGLRAAPGRRAAGAQGRGRRLGQPSAGRVRVSRAPGADARNRGATRRATTACSTRWRRSSGCTTTSPPSAATRATSRSSASRPARLR